jgi:hypothetical protein
MVYLHQHHLLLSAVVSSNPLRFLNMVIVLKSMLDVKLCEVLGTSRRLLTCLSPDCLGHKDAQLYQMYSLYHGLGPGSLLIKISPVTSPL